MHIYIYICTCNDFLAITNFYKNYTLLKYFNKKEMLHYIILLIL